MSARSPAHLAFGQSIRDLRRARGLSQEALALESGLDRSYFGGIERGERNVSLTNVFKIAAALGVPASEIHLRAEALLSAIRQHPPGARGSAG
ncbi:MAG TPA: helix-turn-helix transcriptional regulator [Solirubrobacteraceae bacterium]|nr:helix-turn-helix transcriptional regulator [Solirubrobacteraceae bacterium]